MNIKQTAMEYKQTDIKNITELEKVSVNCEISKKKFTKENGEDFEINIVNIDNVEYRLPTSVIAQLNILLEDAPELEFFKVKKVGEGLNTKYTVIPVQ
jgi:hypothetical protein